jgi:hypothetical protein
MRRNPDRIAWTVLLTSFVIFCLVAIGCPMSVRSYLLHARQGLQTWLNSQRGTLRVERTGSNRVDAISLDDPSPLQLFKGDSLRTGDLEQGLLTLQRGDQEDRETVGTVVVYDNSTIVLIDAYTPRFGFSPDPQEAVLQVKEGRIRIEVQPAEDGRPVRIQVLTDHGRIELSEGSYVLEVTNQQTTAAVRSGQASIRVEDQEFELSDKQRAIVSREGAFDGPLPAEDNLIVNGDFGQGLDVGWIARGNASDPTGRVSITTDNRQPVARFEHEQAQPLEVGLIQTINRTVRDLESLVLHLKVKVNSHSLSVCGTKGSECPVMVRIDYIDAAGGNRQWVHGFYASEDPRLSAEVPYNCLTCPQPGSGNHSQVAAGTWFLYDSPNLMEITPQEFRPAIIQSLHVYASGHSYDSMVTDIELLAQE